MSVCGQGASVWAGCECLFISIPVIRHKASLASNLLGNCCCCNQHQNA